MFITSHFIFSLCFSFFQIINIRKNIIIKNNSMNYGSLAVSLWCPVLFTSLTFNKFWRIARNVGSTGLLTYFLKFQLFCSYKFSGESIWNVYLNIFIPYFEIRHQCIFIGFNCPFFLKQNIQDRVLLSKGRIFRVTSREDHLPILN